MGRLFKWLCQKRIEISWTWPVSFLDGGRDRCKFCGAMRRKHPETHRFVEEST